MSSVEPELNLHGLTVDEALWELERYLNEAFLAGLASVRVVHGKGTGTLRRVVREELRKHSLVHSFRPAELSEGGPGATVVRLAER